MAQEMTEVIRSGLASWSRGDLGQAMPGLAPDIEFVTSGVLPGLDRVYRGHDGFAKFFGDFREPGGTSRSRSNGSWRARRWCT